MPRLLVFTQDLDFYSEQLLTSLTRHGWRVAVVSDPQHRGIPKWQSQLAATEPVELRGRLDAKAARKYAAEVARYQPDICLCYTSRALSIALQARRMAGFKVPIIGTRGAVGGLSCWYLQDWFSYLNPSLDGVVGMSDAIQRKLAHEATRLWPGHPGFFTRIYQGYSSLLATAVKRDHAARAGAATRIIGTISNERPIKGMGLLLDALEHHLRFDDWKLVWIGNASEASKARIAASPRLKDRVCLLGYRSDARKLIAESDIYVQPTLAPGEGIGNAIAEAMAAEIAVVTSDIGGAPELVRPVSQQLLFKPDNAASLAATLDRLLADPAACEQWGRASAGVLAEKFRFEDEVQAYLALFEKLSLASVTHNAMRLENAISTRAT
jgi:glycosyltransferase involved in cell wall biosynthesis